MMPYSAHYSDSITRDQSVVNLAVQMDGALTVYETQF